MFKGLLIASIVPFSFSVIAADVVPYSVKTVRPAGAAYLELAGPGKMQVDGETMAYEGKKYISTRNIDSMTDSDGGSKGCTLHYSSENYTEDIFVSKQSCKTIISIISLVN